MMKHARITSYFYALKIPFLLFLTLIFSYVILMQSVPISYWDEVLWISRSYHLQYMLQRDFDNPIWNAVPSYDQPKLAELSYGIWLYPKFLKEKMHTSTPLDYTRYLIMNGFAEIESPMITGNEQYVNSFSQHARLIAMSGSPNVWIERYGSDVQNFLKLIFYTRILDAILLAGAVVFAYLLVRQYAGIWVALPFSLLYGFNTLFTQTGLKTHAEALFVFLFNSGLFVMHRYFSSGKSKLTLLVFSLLSGLCVSTKLNGLTLAIIFITVALIQFGESHTKTAKQLLPIIPVIAFTFITFILLNPFTYTHPIENSKFMFNWRNTVASKEQASITDRRLETFSSRLQRIASNYYFSDQVYYFNGILGIKNIALNPLYGVGAFALLIIGLFRMIRRVSEKDITATILLCACIIIIELLGNYLVLDWTRYYIQLQLFIILFQTLGAEWIITKGYLKIQNISRST